MRSTNASVLLKVLRPFVSSEPPGSPIGVAYSGGRDSAVLLWGLSQLVAPQRIWALHVDHGWRSPEERSAEVALVQLWCHRLGVELCLYSPPETPGRTEAQARRHRFECFAAFLGSHPGATVYLAHHADDQAETILMRMVKGRSWQGLGGMAPRRGPFRRPLLGLRASVLAGVAQELAIPFHTDSTNQDLRLTRNFLRLQILPQLQERFPRVIEALGELGAVWASQEGAREPHPAWSFTPQGARVEPGVWDRWSSLERQAQLLAVVNRHPSSGPLSRRFLEQVCADARSGAARAGGWFWSRSSDEVLWQMVAPRVGKGYFIRVAPGRVYDVGAYRFEWTGTGAHALFVPGVDPELPWVWRSTVPGMELSSADHRPWGRSLRKKRFGSLDPRKAALVFQSGLLRAVVDPEGKRVVWAESDDEKLHKPGIFVTLITVTPITTE